MAGSDDHLQIADPLGDRDLCAGASRHRNGNFSGVCVHTPAGFGSLRGDDVRLGMEGYLGKRSGLEGADLHAEIVKGRFP